MKVLVVGGAGYIGLATCEMLRDLGYDVWILDIRDQVRPFILNLKIKYLLGSVLDVAQHKSALAGFDVIINLTGGLDDAHLMGLGVHFVAQACSVMHLKRANEQAKIIHVSTQYVYNSSEPGELEMHSEREKPKPGCDYGISHIMAEQALASDDSSIVLRFGTVWGKTRNTRWDTWGNHIFYLKRKNELIDLNHPHRTISMLTIHNAIKVICWAMGDVSGTYNVADKVGLREDLARELLGDFPFTNRRYSTGYSIGMDCSKIKKAGFQFDDSVPRFE